MLGNHYSETRFAANGGPGTTPKLDSLPARWGALLRNSICCQRVGPRCFQTRFIVGVAWDSGCFLGVELRTIVRLRPVLPDQLSQGTDAVRPSSQVAPVIDASLART